MEERAKDIDDADRIVLRHVVVQAGGTSLQRELYKLRLRFFKPC